MYVLWGVEIIFTGEEKRGGDEQLAGVRVRAEVFGDLCATVSRKFYPIVFKSVVYIELCTYIFGSLRDPQLIQ